MEAETKKKVMLGVSVVLICLAGFILYASLSDKQYGIEDMKTGVMVLMKCRECEHEFEVDKKEYYKFWAAHPMASTVPPMGCPQCAKEAAYLAHKCEKCEHVFFDDMYNNDFSDRCPECGYSKKEERRKEAHRK